MLRKEYARLIKKDLESLKENIDELYTIYENDYYEASLVKFMLDSARDIEETLERLRI